MKCEFLKTIFDAGASLAAIVSCFLSYKAIKQTNSIIKQTEKQIELSNKQELFDKRIKLFLALNEFIKCCELCEKIEIDNKHNEINTKDILVTLLSNIYLNDVKNIIVKPKNNELLSKFNEKLIFINNMSVESSMLFNNEYGKESKYFLINIEIS